MDTKPALRALARASLDQLPGMLCVRWSRMRTALHGAARTLDAYAERSMQSIPHRSGVQIHAREWARHFRYHPGTDAASGMVATMLDVGTYTWAFPIADAFVRGEYVESAIYACVPIAMRSGFGALCRYEQRKTQAPLRIVDERVPGPRPATRTAP